MGKSFIDLLKNGKSCFTLKAHRKKEKYIVILLEKKSWTVKSALSHSVSDKFHMLSLDDPDLYIIIIIITLSCLGLIYINQLLQLQKTAEIKLPKLKK